ncbi:HD domain-containing protein [Barrientosiimonas marina]|uniref:HD domain-containing protein n=1 Tax=Lentibacillus kimchii TaxID=1542911 RepID=A0ABW2UZZ6_9BACI
MMDRLLLIRNYVFNLFDRDVSGHDFFHMQRVAQMAQSIAVREQADLFITETAAWLHDADDHKLFTDGEKQQREITELLQSIACSSNEISQIKEAIREVSFTRGAIPASLEGKIVQDADRLDAIGAIGIARAFAYGATTGQTFWDDQETLQPYTTIQHFYDKLLKLTDMMNTDAGEAIAAQRHQFMTQFLQQFFAEWQTSNIRIGQLT